MDRKSSSMYIGRRWSAALRAALAAVLLCAQPVAHASEPIPIFDAHLHYNWEPTPHLTLEQVLTLFRANGISGILATSRPNDGTRALYAARSKDLWVVPFIRPYRVRPDIQTWMNDNSIQDLIETEYQRGYYQGIGEFHLSGSAADTPLVKRTVDFAVARNLYLHAHADDEALEILYRHNPQARIIWAHTGFSTSAEKVEAYLRRYPNLWCELSYRYGITDGNGRLSAEWKRLFERYPDRFLLGSDTWINARWDAYGEIMTGYRQWLAQLPAATAAKIAHGNAAAVFRPAP